MLKNARECAKTLDNGALSHRQEQALTLLLSGKHNAVVAKEVGVHETTIRRWLKDETFQSHYREGRRQIFSERLDALEATIFATMIKHLKAEVEVTAGSQIQALRLWFEMKQMSQDMQELEQRFNEWTAQEQADRAYRWQG